MNSSRKSREGSRYFLVWLLIELSSAPASLLVASDTVPEQFQKLFDQGQYQPLLTQLNTAIAKTSKTDTSLRYSLLILKGETLMHLKASGSAQQAFHAAALVAPDEDAIAIANATVTLLKHASSNTYQAKTQVGSSKENEPPIDILDKTSRKDAFSALFTDQFTLIKPEIDNMENITSIQPLVSLAQRMKVIRDIEIASVGSAPQSKDVLQKLASRIATLMTDALKPLLTQVAAVGADAAKRQNNAGGKMQKDDPSSLTIQDTSQLAALVSQARQIESAAGQMPPIFCDSAVFKPIGPDAEKVITAANKILTQYKHHAT